MLYIKDSQVERQTVKQIPIKQNLDLLEEQQKLMMGDEGIIWKGSQWIGEEGKIGESSTSREKTIQSKIAKMNVSSW